MIINHHNDEQPDSIGGMQSMGILNALRTGDPRVDMVLAMLLPFVIQFMLHSASRAQAYLAKLSSRYFSSDPRYHERVISEETTRNEYGYVSSLDPDSHNGILLKALRHYLHSVVNLDVQGPRRAFDRAWLVEQDGYGGLCPLGRGGVGLGS